MVLKGGNAIDLTYQSEGKDHGSRTSYDLDYSIEKGDFSEDLITISERVERTLVQTFNENGYQVIDYRFLPKPKNVREEVADFWGGYKVEFKLVPSELYDEHKGDLEKLRRKSVSLNPDTSPTFELEFSKFEYVGHKVETKVDGFKIYIYAPEMIVFEKVRALCQQMPAYKEIVPSFSPRARARDFYDIHLMMETHKIDPNTTENLEMIRNIFLAKKVPLEFLKKLREESNYHADNWKDVRATLPASTDIKDFEYYRDYVIKKFSNLTFP